MSAAKAKQLLGQFRKSDADDPDIFITAVTALLADFPPCVVDHVCSPVTGMAVRSPWPPSIFELREAAISHMNFLIAKHEVDKIAPDRLARITGRVQERLAPPKQERLTSTQLKAKYGGSILPHDFGSDGVTNQKKSDHVPPTLGEIVAHYTANKTLGIPLHRPMKEESNGQDKYEEGYYDEGVMADTLPAGGSVGEEERTSDRRIEAAAEESGGAAQAGTRQGGGEEGDQENPPPREDGDPGPA